MLRPYILVLAVLAQLVRPGLGGAPPWYLVANTMRAALVLDPHVSAGFVEFLTNGTCTSNCTAAYVVQVDLAVAPCCRRLPPPAPRPRNKAGRRLMQGPARNFTTCIKDCAAAAAKARSLSTLLAAAAAASTNGMAQQVRVNVTQGGVVIKPGVLPRKEDAPTHIGRAMFGNAFFKRIEVKKLTLNGVVKTGSITAVFRPGVVQYYSGSLGQLGGLTSAVVAEIMDDAFGLLQLYGITSTSEKCTGSDCPKPVV